MPSRAPGLALRGLCSSQPAVSLRPISQEQSRALWPAELVEQGPALPHNGSINHLMTTHLGEDLSSTASLLPCEPFILSPWPVEWQRAKNRAGEKLLGGLLPSSHV